MNLHYSAKIKCTKGDKLVNDSIKDSHQNEMIYYSAEGLSRCKGVRLSGIYREKKLVSFAYSMKRIWNDSQKPNGISIGLVTTVKGERNKGFARQLIRK